MNRDLRRLLAIHGEANRFQSLCVRLEALVSAEARRRHRRLAAVSGILRHALSDPDANAVIVKQSKPPAVSGEVLKWLVLAGLSVVAAVEFRTYTFPIVGSWLRTVMHHCGL